ncbi:hypothetical protein [Frigidibacter sp. ROC022]|uniref:hypothetical protein n=1 Tax=Frigidibacter sp. ROC022 TaxID=2971796 RepID=UPI00215AB252|nr:hypothetical protein [Frigidibacter sp. ROC022]MCR8726438.1 hypothetical protein [Frigidibacter sp. ROC022]
MLLVEFNRLYLDFLARGGSWKQGDWLITLAAGPLRRGILGSAILWGADALHIGPITAVVGLQALLLTVLVAGTLIGAWRFLGRPEMAALILSPALFPVFWANNPFGAERKELIGFAAFALVAVAQTRSKVPGALLALAVVVFLIGAFGHEANALLAPAFAVMLWIAGRQKGVSGPGSLVLPALALAGSAAAIAYALRYSSVADVTPLCQPLIDRGLDPRFCDTGAIAWMDKDIAFGRAAVAGMLKTWPWQGFFLVYLAASAPAIYAAWCCRGRRLLLGLFLLTGLAILPLYPVAMDWGRWLDLHMVSFTFLFLSLLLAGRVALQRPGRLTLVLPMLIAGLLWSPAHVYGIKIPILRTLLCPFLEACTQ